MPTPPQGRHDTHARLHPANHLTFQPQSGTININNEIQDACLREKNLRLSVRDAHTYISARARGVLDGSKRAPEDGSYRDVGVEAVQAAGATAVVGCENNHFSTKSAERVCIGSDVQVGVVIGSKAANRFLGGKKLLDECVDVASGRVATAPQVLAIRGVVAASVALLRAAVEDGDTSGEDGECKRVLEEGPVGVDVQEALNIVVVKEGSEELGAFEIAADGVVLVDEVLEVDLAGVRVGDRVVHWEIDQRRHGVLVRTNIGWVAVENLAN